MGAYRCQGHLQGDTRPSHPVARRATRAKGKPAGDTGNKKGEIIGDIPDKTEITGETGDLTMLPIPQTLPEERLTINSPTTFTGTARNLRGILFAGKTLSRVARLPTVTRCVEHPHHPDQFILQRKDPATDV